MRNKLPFLLVLALIVSSALWVSPASADSGTDPFTLSQSSNELSSGNTQASIQSLAWYDGLIQYSSILNCASIIGGFPYIEYGMGTYVGFIADPEAAAPGINQVYYVHVVVAGLGNSCAGQRAFIDVQLPANTSLAITPSTPVHCFAGGNPISPPPAAPKRSLLHHSIPEHSRSTPPMLPTITPGRCLREPSGNFRYRSNPPQP